MTATCNDNNVCTNDSCSTNTGCQYVHNTVDCNDGNKCTQNDVCSAGKCAGAAVSCGDKNDCTIDTCKDSVGCIYTSNTGAECNLYNNCIIKAACTQYGACVGEPACGYVTAPCLIVPCSAFSSTGSLPACGLGGGKTEYQRDCGDSNACTLDACGKAGCEYTTTNEGAACDNGGKICKSGLCVPKQ